MNTDARHWGLWIRLVAVPLTLGVVVGSSNVVAHAATQGMAPEPVVTITGSQAMRIDRQDDPVTVTVSGIARGQKTSLSFGDSSPRQVLRGHCVPAKAARQPQACSVSTAHEYGSSGTFTVTVRVAGQTIQRLITMYPTPVPWQPPPGWMQPAGWSMLTNAATFTPCAHVTWIFDRANEPANRATTIDDVRAAFAILAPQTGLTFTEVPATDAAQIRLSWTPGLSSAGRGGGTGGSGTVELSPETPWTQDTWAGTGLITRQWTDEQGTWTSSGPGRAWLVVHELGHVLGLGHVADATQLMSPINQGQVALGTGDLDGLHTMYLNNPCPPIPD